LVPKRQMSAGEERRYAEFRRLLVEEREKAGLSQAELGAKLDPPRPQSYVGKIELGARRLDALEFWDLARAVGYDPCALMKKLKSELDRRPNKPVRKANQTKK
jgi:transcriptional regulator with XRE-family HTH domain